MPRVHRHTVDRTDAPSEEGNTMPTPPCATTTKASQNSKMSSMRKIGGGYQRRIVFLPWADSGEGGYYHISHEELETRMLEYIRDENILTVTIYKHKLYSWQRTQALLYHAFIVLETEEWWWSAEKNADGVFVQRSKHQWAVRNRLEGKERPRTTLLEHDTSHKTLRNFVFMLWATRAVESEYHFLRNNCKDFAKVVFDSMACDKRWKI